MYRNNPEMAALDNLIMKRHATTASVLVAFAFAMVPVFNFLFG